MAKKVAGVIDFDLILPAKLKSGLFAHLFPGDGDEHGAIISAGVVHTDRGLRLLARDLFLAEDGVDYIPGERGYRMLTPRFVMEKFLNCRDQKLAYLAIHNHGEGESVGFSEVDLASHERGYPALVDILQGQPVGALVFAKHAVAGDLWLPSGGRATLREGRAVGGSIERLYPNPPPAPLGVDLTYDRQARLFGDRGQSLLNDAKIGIIGAGGVGALLVIYMARLGVGHMVVVDPDRIDITNLSRVPGATRFDARTWFTANGRPEWLQRLGRRISTRKVDIMRRVARRANRDIRFEGIFGNVVDDAVAMQFRDCDFLFLAADTHQARLVFNSLVHQYLIPGVQVGSKVSVDKVSGEINDVFSVVRSVIPDSGCLWCAKLIDQARLAEESLPEEERERLRYIEEVPAPSVVTLNGIGASHAANEFLFSWTGLRLPTSDELYLYYRPRERKEMTPKPLRKDACTECGMGTESRRARGDSTDLPTR